MKLMKIVSMISILLFSQAIKLRADDFKDKLYRLKWVAYAPTRFNPAAGVYPVADSIEEDLRLLFAAGFNGLVTYGAESSLKDIPRIAKSLGFKGVIMGVWDIDSQQEWLNAIEAKDYVDGYCIGNEGLGLRYELDALKEKIDYIKIQTGKPATTTEQIEDYAKRDVVDIGDWVFPNAHPIFHNISDTYKCVKWITHQYKIVARAAGDKPVLFKECGFSTRGCRQCSEKAQRDFFIYLKLTNVKFVYFEAFDQYWKTDREIEPYWGLFDKARNSKLFIKDSDSILK